MMSAVVPFAMREPTAKNSAAKFFASTRAMPLSQVSIFLSRLVVVGEVRQRVSETMPPQRQRATAGAGMRSRWKNLRATRVQVEPTGSLR